MWPERRTATDGDPDVRKSLAARIMTARPSPVDIFEKVPARKLVTRLTKSATVRGITALAGGVAVGQLIVAAVTPIVSRIYAPTAIGVFSVYFAYVSFAQTAGSLMYSSAIPAAPDDTSALNLARLSYRLIWVTSGVAALGLWLLSRAGVLGLGVVPPWAPTLAFGSVTLTSAFTTMRFILVREQIYTRIGRAVLLQNAVRGIGQVFGGLLDPMWGMLATADIGGRTVGVFNNTRRIRQKIKEAPRQSLTSVAKQYRDYPIYYLPSTLIDAAVALLPVALIASIYGPRSAGYFGLVTQLLSLPLALIASSAADVFHGRMAERARNGGDVSKLFWETAALLGAIGIPLSTCLALFAPSLFPAILGREWGTSGHLAALMAPWLMMQLVVSPLSRVVIVFQVQRLKLLYDLTALVGLVTTYIVARMYRVDLADFVIALSAVNVLAYFGYLMLIVRVVRNASRPSTAR